MIPKNTFTVSDAVVAGWLDDAVPRLVSMLRVQKVILFGSFARETASRHSDIDLLVIWDTPLHPLARIETILEVLRDAPRPVEVVALTPDELTRRSHSRFIRDALAEGVVLHE
jgi:uncharacterized protein